MTKQEIASAVRLWAAGEPLVRRVYLFGSRARCTNQPASDIDLAVVYRMDPRVLATCGGEYGPARFWFWENYDPIWRTGLSQRFPVPVHLHLLDRDARCRVRPAVKRDGIRIV